jgi:uncharacterized protein YdaU (DUF1376 family)
MSAPPYMKLYIAEYLAETTHLDAIGHGAYLLLIMAMWRAGGKLPRDETKLARIAQCTPDQWSAVRDDVMAFFRVSGGAIRHNRVSKEIAKYDAVIEGAKSAGKASASKRANKNNDQGGNVRSENVERKTNQPEPEEDNRTPISPKGDAKPAAPKIILRQADVELAWSVTPPRARQRTSKADILKALQGAARRGHQPAAVIEGLRAYYASAEATKDGGEYAKGTHRVITADRWQGFIDAATPLEAFSASASADPLESWRRRVNAFVNGSRFWNPTDWGPEPGRPGSEVPAHVQREFGFEPARLEGAAA